LQAEVNKLRNRRRKEADGAPVVAGPPPYVVGYPRRFAGDMKFPA
jgi:hypothetical protein